MTDTVTRDNARTLGNFEAFRKTTTTEISTFSVPPGTPFETPEGLRADDEACRIAFDVQGGVYPIRESVFAASYAPAEPVERLTANEVSLLRAALDEELGEGRIRPNDLILGAFDRACVRAALAAER